MKYLVLTIVFALLLTCGSSFAASVDAKVTARNVIIPQIKQGMGFAAFRRLVMANGWEPIANLPRCEQQAAKALCAKLPELASVSSGAVEYNEVAYRHKASGETLDVMVTGDIERWNTPDVDELSLDSWEFGKTAN